MLSISACSVLIFVSAFCKAIKCDNSAFTLYRLLRYLGLLMMTFMQTNNHTERGRRARWGSRVTMKQVPRAVTSGSQRLERNRPGCPSEYDASEDACAPVAVATAPGTDFIFRRICYFLFLCLLR